MNEFYRFYFTYFLIINCSYVYTNFANDNNNEHQQARIRNSIKYGTRGHIKRSNITTDQRIVTNTDNGGSDLSRIQRRRLTLYPEWLSKRVQDFVGKHFPHKYFHANQRNNNARDIILQNLINRRKGLARYMQDISNSEKQNNYRRSYYGTPYIYERNGNNLQSDDNEMPDDASDVRRIPVPTSLSGLGAELVDIPPHFREVAPNSLADYIREKASHYDSRRDNEDWVNFDDNHHDEMMGDYRIHHHKHSLHHPCRHHTCLNGGRCYVNKHHSNRYRCNCREGFKGHYCEVTQFSCHPNPCENDGICTKREQGFSCSCDTLYKGSDCKIKAICPTAPCRNGGTCVELESSFMCRCVPQFGGLTCENKINSCSSNPCKNGASCLETGNSFKCKCADGYTCDDCSCKSSTAAVRKLPVSCPEYTCKNGGTCLVTQSGFSCTCLPLFHGNDCAIPDTCTPNPCENGGLCVQVGSDYKCVCTYGYKGNNCREQLACITHPCTNGGICHEDDESGFHCKCSRGYKGTTCTDLSPCSASPCAHEAECDEKGPLFTCLCKAGFQGNECNERDLCFPTPCKNNGACHVKHGIATCNCTSSFIGDLCEIRNECHPNKCQNGGTCVHNAELVHCVCTEQYHGPNCEKINPCFENPCKRNGVCQRTEESYICVCDQGYRGRNCEVAGLCHPNPCHHSGDCYEGDDTFICECPTGYAGKMCEIQDFCEADRCHNGGSCIEEIGTYSCSCPLGYLGETCGVSVCYPNPCKNGGTCMPSNTEHGYACECVFPFHGLDCEAIDPCLPNPCRNGGSCKSHLKEIKELHLHEGSLGSLVHGTDDSVVTVVGPEESEPEALERDEAFHYPNKYEEHFRKALPHHKHQHKEHVDSYLEREHGDAIDYFHALKHHPEMEELPLVETEELHGQLYQREPIEDETDFHAESKVPADHIHALPEPEPYQESAEDIEDVSDHHVVPELHGDYLQPGIQTGIQGEIYGSIEGKQDKDTTGGIQGEIYGSSEDKQVKDTTGGIQGEIYGSSEGKQVKDTAGISKIDEDAVAQISQSVVKAVLEETKKHGLTTKRSNISKETSSIIQKRTLQDLYVCQCRPGFLGAYCQHSNPCERSPCKNGGTCIPRGARYQCNCPAGYGGLKCDDW